MQVLATGYLANKLHMEALQSYNNDDISTVKRIAYKSIRTLMPSIEKSYQLTVMDDDYYDVLSAAKSLQKILELVKHCRIVNGLEERCYIEIKKLVEILEGNGRALAI
jgi:hypothetical protein